jgi:hypothetical protein
MHILHVNHIKFSKIKIYILTGHSDHECHKHKFKKFVGSKALFVVPLNDYKKIIIKFYFTLDLFIVGSYTNFIINEITNITAIIIEIYK